MIGNPNYRPEQVDISVKQLNQHLDNQVSKKSYISNASSSYEQLQCQDTGCSPLGESLEVNAPAREGSHKYMDMSLSTGQADSKTGFPKPALGHAVHYSIVVKK